MLSLGCIQDNVVSSKGLQKHMTFSHVRLHDWVYWENDDESMETNESDNRRRMLQFKINELKEKIHG